MLEMELDRERGVLRWRMSGFWTLDTVKDYERALVRHGTELIRSGRPFKGLSDGRAFPVQSAEVSDALGAQSKRLALPGTRMAVLVSSMLSKKQIERTTPNSMVRVFRDEEEALAWLDLPEQEIRTAQRATAQGG